MLPADFGTIPSHEPTVRVMSIVVAANVSEFRSYIPDFREVHSIQDRAANNTRWPQAFGTCRVADLPKMEVVHGASTSHLCRNITSTPFVSIKGAIHSKEVAH